MKKLILIIICLLATINIMAQKKQTTKRVKSKRVEETGNRFVGIHAGTSLTGLMYEILENDSAPRIYTTSVKPAFQASLDYFFSNKVTVGFFTSVQPFKVDITYWEFGDTLNPQKIENRQAKMHRIYIGGRLLYHFKNTEKIDIYSGIRGGLLMWKKNLPNSNPDFATSFQDEIPMFNRPALGIIPLGFRIKFTPQFAANVELNATAPHFFSFGGSYTF